MTLTLVPKENWLVIKPRPKAESVGRIAMPELDAQNIPVPQLGDIVAAGPGRTNEAGQCVPMKLKVGDVVLLNGLTFRWVPLNGPDDVHLMLRENEIGCLVEGAGEPPLPSNLVALRGVN